MIQWIVGAVVFVAIMLGAGFFIIRRMLKSKVASLSVQTKELVATSKREADQIMADAKIKAQRELDRVRDDLNRDRKNQQAELSIAEKRILQKEQSLDRKVTDLDRKEAEVTKYEQSLRQKEDALSGKTQEYQQLVEQSKKELSRIASLTEEEAKRKLIELVEDEARHEASKRAMRIEMETVEEAEKKAKRILSIAVQRYAGEYISERAVSVVQLPSDEMKGRIIGKEGRNIRALEALTGIDVIVDETPGAVILSGFHPIRREIARLAMIKLIEDGRIHPARIEELVRKAENDVEGEIKEAGQKATFDLGIHGLHPEIIRLVGALKYRYSYSQNQYQHSLEVGFLAGMVASELGVNIKQAKRAALLHDIGKALTHEVEGSHAIVGADFAKRHGESYEIWHAIGAHHESDQYKLESPLDYVVLAADCMSGARPGARREMLESYIHRVEEIEKIANSFEGVEKSYAIQAGREVRVLVSSDKVDDEGAMMLASEISRKIEKDLTYPGEVKITVIREKRAVSYAR